MLRNTSLIYSVTFACVTFALCHLRSLTLKRLFRRSRFIVGAGLAVSIETSLAEAEGVGLTLPGGNLLDSLHCFPARHGLGVARTRLEDHFPEPPGLGPVTTLLGHDRKFAQVEVAVCALVNAAGPVGTLERQDPPPTGFGLGRLASLAVEDRLAEMQLGVVGGRAASPPEQAFNAAGRSPSIWWQRAIRAKSLRTMELVGADLDRLRWR